MLGGAVLATAILVLYSRLTRRSSTPRGDRVALERHGAAEQAATLTEGNRALAELRRQASTHGTAIPNPAFRPYEEKAPMYSEVDQGQAYDEVESGPYASTAHYAAAAVAGAPGAAYDQVV